MRRAYRKSAPVRLCGRKASCRQRSISPCAQTRRVHHLSKSLISFTRVAAVVVGIVMCGAFKKTTRATKQISNKPNADISQPLPCCRTIAALSSNSRMLGFTYFCASVCIITAFSRLVRHAQKRATGPLTDLRRQKCCQEGSIGVYFAGTILSSPAAQKSCISLKTIEILFVFERCAPFSDSRSLLGNKIEGQISAFCLST